MPKPDSHDAYLATLPADQRALLSQLRARIRHIVPEAEECISYAMPAFRLGKPFAGYSATTSHCSFFPFSGATLKSLAPDLAGFKWSPGGVQFTAAHPLPEALVRKIIAARLAEIATSGK